MQVPEVRGESLKPLAAIIAFAIGCLAFVSATPKRYEVGKWSDEGTMYVGVYFEKDIAKVGSYRAVASVARSGWRVEYVSHYMDADRRKESGGYSQDSIYTTNEVQFGGFYPEHTGKHYFTVECERVWGDAKLTPEDVMFEIGEVE